MVADTCGVRARRSSSSCQPDCGALGFNDAENKAGVNAPAGPDSSEIVLLACVNMCISLCTVEIYRHHV